MCLICYFLPPLQWDPAESRSQSSSPERGGLVLCSALLCLHSHPGLWLPAAAEPLTASLLRSLWPRSGTEKYPPPLPPDTTVSLSLPLWVCAIYACCGQRDIQTDKQKDRHTTLHYTRQRHTDRHRQTDTDRHTH